MITRVPAKEHEQASTSQGEPNASKEESSFKLFSDSDIMIATNNLSKESVIGRGGFGNVHKGTIVNTEVAIKILDTKGTQGANEFIQEMAVLKNLKHENLVKLMGACLELRALVYEFLPRGSLEDCLNNSPRLLTWQIRARIVYEVCSALMFLHSMKPKPLVHGDLKPQNVLLDADLHCRLSDFGLCRVLPEFSETTGAFLQTKSINGTECYLDPDYVEYGKITPGCDVFSFGVTILRILTGQRPSNIRKKIRKASRSNSLMTIVDSTAGDWPVEVAEYLSKSGLDCCKGNRNNLKLMTELSTFLKNLAEKGFCEMSRKCQPDLVGEVPRVLEPTMEANSSSVSTLSSGSDNADNSPIPSYFLSQVTAALREAGLESSNLIVGIDFTKSNEWTGKYSFNNRSLHAIGNQPNPYEQAISIVGKTLAPFDEDNLIPCFGFGDATTHDQEVFSFHADNSPCHGFEEVLACYRRIIPNLRLSGPTSFAPIVEAAVDIVERSGGQYHVLVIIADGQVTRSVNTDIEALSPQEEQTINSIVMASSYPLSIVLVGVGDGPWEDMKKFDDKLPARDFDNFQFVNFTAIMTKNLSPAEKEAAFALAALMEIPIQYKATKEFKLLGQTTGKAKRVVPRPPPIPSTQRRPSLPRVASISPPPPPPPQSSIEDQNQVCPICLTNAKNLAFGCGHMCCTECGQNLAKCPICRTVIRTRLKLYS